MRQVKSISNLIFVALTATTIGISNSVIAQAKSIKTESAQDLYQRGLSATCANCHGTDGNGVENATMPVINHLNSEQILTQLRAFKSGVREGTIMPQLAKGYTDEQMQSVANFLGKK
jgi:cytochrome c553